MGLRERKRAQLIERIQEATVAMIRRDGFEAVTVDAIVRQVEISPPTFYKYFHSKEDILRSIAGARLQSGFSDGQLRAEEGALTGQLQDFFTALPAWMDADKSLWRAMVLADALNPFRWPEQREQEADRLAWLYHRIEQAQQAGELGQRFDAECIAHALVSIQSMTLLEWAVSDWTVDELTRRLLQGLEFVLAGAEG